MRSLASIALLICGLDGSDRADPEYRQHEVSRIEQHYKQFFQDGLGRVPGAIDAEIIFDFFPELISGPIDDVAEFYQNIGRKHTSVLGRGSFQITKEDGDVSRHYLIVKVKQPRYCRPEEGIPDEGPMVFVFKPDGSLEECRYHNHEVQGSTLLRQLHRLLGRTDKSGEEVSFQCSNTKMTFSSNATSVLRNDITTGYRELIASTDLTTGEILDRFSEDTHGLRFTEDGGDHPRVSTQDQLSEPVLRRGEFPMFWRSDQAQVYGHYLMFKFKQFLPSKSLFFIFNQNGDLTSYKLYDGTTWRSSKRSGDYGADEPDEWAMSSLKLIRELLWGEVVTFDFGSYVGQGGSTLRGDHQETLKMQW